MKSSCPPTRQTGLYRYDCSEYWLFHAGSVLDWEAIRKYLSWRIPQTRHSASNSLSGRGSDHHYHSYQAVGIRRCCQSVAGPTLITGPSHLDRHVDTRQSRLKTSTLPKTSRHRSNALHLEIADSAVVVTELRIGDCLDAVVGVAGRAYVG